MSKTTKLREEYSNFSTTSENIIAELKFVIENTYGKVARAALYALAKHTGDKDYLSKFEKHGDIDHILE